MKKIYYGVLALLISGSATVFGQVTFNFTGAMQTYVVPATGTYMLECWGAQGGNILDYQPITGGEGGYASGEIMLTAGQTLNIYVGGKGMDRNGNHPYASCTVAAGGWNGGGQTSSAGNSTPGGGASDIRLNGTALADRIIVAGGGGGCGWTYAKGGAGGGLTGQNGTQSNNVNIGAYGGSQLAGGAVGTGSTSCLKTAGVLGDGGAGGGSSAGGGGGGGGYYGGGGGGYYDGGGGGSSYIDMLTNGTTTLGGHVGDGVIIITQLCSPTMITADQASLSDVVETCEVSVLAVPTATNDCGLTVSGTHDAVLPITANGTTIVTWTYDDGSGNTTTQVQNVTITGLNPIVTQNNSTLMVNQIQATYQWIDCDNGNTAIAGEVNQFYVASTSGSYAVVVTKDGCVDTSACFVIDFSGLNELTANELSLYPNPVHGDDLSINFDGIIEQIEVFDIVGRKVKVHTNLDAKQISAGKLSAGKYTVKLTTNEGIAVRNLIVQ